MVMGMEANAQPCMRSLSSGCMCSVIERVVRCDGSVDQGELDKTVKYLLRLSPGIFKRIEIRQNTDISNVDQAVEGGFEIVWNGEEMREKENVDISGDGIHDQNEEDEEEQDKDWVRDTIISCVSVCVSAIVISVIIKFRNRVVKVKFN
jgi:hypothetical protein